MVKYYVRYNDLQTQAASLQNIGKTLASFESRLISIANAVDGQDNSMAILKTQIKNCGNGMPSLASKASDAGRTVTEICNIYFNAEKCNYTSLTGISINEIENTINEISINALIFATYPIDYVTVLEAMSDSLKKSKKVISSFEDLLKLFGKDNVLVEAMKKTGIYQAIDYTSTATKLIEGIVNGDSKKIWEFIEKYTKKGAKSVLKNVYGVNKGFTASGYVNIGWNLVENILDIDKFSYAGTSKSPIVGFAQYAWHCTGWTMIETGSEMAYDMIEGISGLIGYDLNKTYENLVGISGVDGFYEATAKLGEELFGDYYKKNGIGGAIQGTMELVGDSLSWWGSKITGLFK